jgi:hypothetical protein
MLTHETVTFRDGDGWSWELDLTFMLSNYQCIWGRGRPDISLQHTARGCGVEGVEIYRGCGDTPGREDLKKIRGRIRELTDKDWQNRRVALQRGGWDPWARRGSSATASTPGPSFLTARTATSLQPAAERRTERLERGILAAVSAMFAGRAADGLVGHALGH